MTRSRLRIVFAALAATALVAVGCGDDDAVDAADTTTVTDEGAANDGATDDGDTDDGDTDDGAAVTAVDAWARASAMMQNAGAIYLELRGGDTDDVLVAASVPADVAAVVEIHETVAADDMGGMDHDGDHSHDGDHGHSHGHSHDHDGDHDHSHDDDSHDHGDGMGMMTMREVGRIDVAAGSTVALEPGGLHIMLLDLAGPLTEGESFEVTLTFESGTVLVVPVDIRR